MILLLTTTCKILYSMSHFITCSMLVSLLITRATIKMIIIKIKTHKIRTKQTTTKTAVGLKEL